MNNAIIFIKNQEENRLSKAPFLGENLIQHVIRELKKLQEISDVYVIGSDQYIPGTLKRNSIDEIMNEIDMDGKSLLVSPLFPELSDEDYQRLLRMDNACVAVYDNEICEAFMIPNRDLNNFENLSYEQVEIKNKKVKKYTIEDALNLRRDNLNDVVILPLTRSIKLAQEICNYLNIEMGSVDVQHFADGETLVELGQSVRGKKVYIVQSTCKPVNDSLMEILICLDAVRRSSAAEINCIIPYYGYARQDRKAKARQPITAKLVSSLIEKAGAQRVVTFDLHAAQIEGFFYAPCDHLTAVPMMGQYFRRKNFDPEDVVVVSPDHGGVKRARNLAEMLDCGIAIIDKRRPRPNVCEACNIIGDVEGKDAILIHDILDTGGSLIAASNMLKENGAKNIYACISHGLFSGNSITRIEDSVIKELVVTNTIEIPEEELAKSSKITTLSVGWILSRLILAVTCHTPVSDVYSLYEA